MSPPDAEIAQRQHWMAVLALSPEAELERHWAALADKPLHRALRPPQIGAAMIRGRIAGSGEPFNLGEMTMTRAAVQLAATETMTTTGTTTGYGHVAGRKPRHAELAALFDALLQTPARRDEIIATVIAPLADAIAAGRAAKAAAVAPSRVEFFTMVRER